MYARFAEFVNDVSRKLESDESVLPFSGKGFTLFHSLRSDSRNPQLRFPARILITAKFLTG
jgi:hypothetical protein